MGEIEGKTAKVPGDQRIAVEKQERLVRQRQKCLDLVALGVGCAEHLAFKRQNRGAQLIQLT